jgi:hypothetical protein
MNILRLYVLINHIIILLVYNFLSIMNKTTKIKKKKKKKKGQTTTTTTGLTDAHMKLNSLFFHIFFESELDILV